MKKNNHKLARQERAQILIKKLALYKKYHWSIWEQNPQKLKYNSNFCGCLKELTFDVKDNFVIKNINTTAGSRILTNYIPSYTATIIQRLFDEGALLLTKSNMDELGHSGTGVNSLYGNCLNPHNIDYMCGGSSGGAAGLVATKIVDFAIASDTGDSARIPALNCGVIGFKPSWGCISRYGLIAYAPSLDTPSIIARSVEVISRVFSVISGFDICDITTYTQARIDYWTQISAMKSKQIKVIIPRKILTSTKKISWSYYEHFQKVIAALKTQNIEITIADFVDLEFVPVIYQIIANCEAISSSANLTANTFGSRYNSTSWNDSFIKSRSNHISIWTKLRWIIGGIAAKGDNFDTIYKKAMQARAKLNEEVLRLFDKYDIFLIPTNINGAQTEKDAIKQYISSYCSEDTSTHMILANLVGMPSVVVATGKLVTNQMPIGVSIYAKRKNDLLCLHFANVVEHLKLN